MEIQLKQRLIGAIVVFTLLIIFLPMFFDPDNSNENIEQLLTPVSTADGANINNISIDSKEISDFMADNSVLLSQNSADKKTVDIHTEQPVIKAEPQVIEEAESIVAKSIAAEAEPVKLKNNMTIVEKLKAAEEQAQMPGKTSMARMARKPSENINNSQTNRTVKYQISSSLGVSDVYAVKVSQAQDNNAAEKIKNRLLGMGFPAYIHKTNNDYNIYVGPDLELKYVKELANRILDETEYQPEIISHNRSWVSIN